MRSAILAGLAVVAFSGAVALAQIGGGITNPGAPSKSPIFTGTVTFPDGSTWAAAGLSDAASYASSTTTAPINFNFTNSYSSTSNGVSAFAITPTLTSTGASSGNINAINLGSTIGGSAKNISQWSDIRLTLTEAAGYSGTVTTALMLNFNNPTVSGTNPFTNFHAIELNAFTNGNGITTGTVTNIGLNAQSMTAAAGVGGTILNEAFAIALPNGSSAGTTNYGLVITGNGGGASTNGAIHSTSTAPSDLAGSMDATAYKVGGVAGVSCSVGTLNTMTAIVVNGIITHC